MIRLVTNLGVVRGALKVHDVGLHGGGAPSSCAPPAVGQRRRWPAPRASRRSLTATPTIRAYEPASRVEYDELRADVRLSCTYGTLLFLSRDQRIAYLPGDLLGFSDTEGAAICDVSPAAFLQRLARARGVMRRLMGDRCGLVRADNPCRCDRLVRASIDRRLLARDDPRWARHGGVTLPIETTAIDQAAKELDLAVAVAEVYRTDPSFAAPTAVWGRAGQSDPHPAPRPMTVAERVTACSASWV